MIVGVVTLALKPPEDPSRFASRCLTFAPPPIDPPAVRSIAPTTTTVAGLRWPMGANVVASLVNVSPNGDISEETHFEIFIRQPATEPAPEAPVVSNITVSVLPDQAPPATPPAV